MLESAVFHSLIMVNQRFALYKQTVNLLLGNKMIDRIKLMLMWFSFCTISCFCFSVFDQQDNCMFIHLKGGVDGPVLGMSALVLELMSKPSDV